MKQNLAASFERVKFDLRKDRLLLKMGGVHTGGGFSPLSLFEIGNTLSERLPPFTATARLHVNFGTKFFTAGGALRAPRSTIKAVFSIAFKA